MKKEIGLIVMGWLIAGTLTAQEYKLARTTGTLHIREVNHVSIEGHAGNEIIFTSRSHSNDEDDRAKGLRAISSMGLTDNTGVGLSVVEKGEIIEVQQLKKMDGPDIVVKVPKSVKVFYTHTSPYGEDVEIKNFEGDLEVSVVHNSVHLSNVAGRLDIKAVHGDIEASLGTALKSPVFIASVHGHVDVALPVTTKANLRIGTSWGEILVDPDFKIEMESTGDLVKYNDKLRGKLNGGGTDIELSSTHNNVYLRKK